MIRTTQEVFNHHKSTFESANLEALIADYADEAILLTLDGEFKGKEAIRGFFENAFKSFPNLTISFDKTAVADDTFLLQWSALSDTATVPHGVATFNIKDGVIRRQTEWMVIVPGED